MWQWYMNSPVWSVKRTANRTVSPGATVTVSFSPASAGPGGRPLRSRIRKCDRCGCIECGMFISTSSLTTVHASVSPSRDRKSTRFMSNTRSLIRCRPVSGSNRMRNSRSSTGVPRSGAGRSSPGTLLGSCASRTTSKRITSGVSPGNDARLSSTTCEPTGYCEKSTTTSMRSPGHSGTAHAWAGAGSRPPSEAICVMGVPSRSRSRKKRSLEVFISRRRYLRAATAKYGLGLPLTRKVGRSMKPCGS